MRYVFYIPMLVLGSMFVSCNNADGELADKDPEGLHNAWGYSGEVSPEHWADLSPDNIKCLEGQLQSPINIETHSTGSFRGDVEFEYHPSHIDVLNNGHTIQATLAEDNLLNVDGRQFRLIQLHFHEPSEHHIDGIIYPMEVHLVHKAKDESFAVVGLFIKEGPTNEYLNMIWDDVPQKSYEHHEEDQALHIEKLLPADRKIYHYVGSLTTPPCTEGVEWLIVDKPISMSQKQIERFRMIHHGNNRPLRTSSRAEVELIGQ